MPSYLGMGARNDNLSNSTKIDRLVDFD